MPSQNKSASARQSFLCEDLLYALCDSVALAVRKEELLEVLTAESAENKLAVKVFKNIYHIGVSYLLNLVEDLLVSLLGNGSLTGITKTPLGNEELLEYVLKVKLAAPAPALCKRHRNCISVVNLGKLICVGGVNHVTAKNAGEGVTSEHCALACAAACDYKVACAGVEKNCGEDTDLNVGKLLLVLCGIHTVIEHLVTERLNIFFIIMASVIIAYISSGSFFGAGGRKSYFIFAPFMTESFADGKCIASVCTAFAGFIPMAGCW